MEDDLIIHGVRFRQAVEAPEDLVLIHPYQVAKMFHCTAGDGVLDVLVVPREDPEPGSTERELILAVTPQR